MRWIPLTAALAAVAAIGNTGALASTTGARGKVCGAKRCITLPARLAYALSRRNGSYSTKSAPKPARYYRIVIKSGGEGFISQTILWLPRQKLWYDMQYLRPPLPGYWRTDDPAVRSKLEAIVRKLGPVPAPAKWSKVLPK
jgi:hypothetical protein